MEGAFRANNLTKKHYLKQRITNQLQQKNK